MFFALFELKSKNEFGCCFENSNSHSSVPNSSLTNDDSDSDNDTSSPTRQCIRLIHKNTTKKWEKDFP